MIRQILSFRGDGLGQMGEGRTRFKVRIDGYLREGPRYRGRKAVGAHEGRLIGLRHAPFSVSVLA